MDYAHQALWQPVYRPPHANIACNGISVRGSYRVKTSIVWRGTRDDRFRTHRNVITEAPTWVRQGPRSAKRLKTLKKNNIWAPGDARSQVRRSTGDVLGALSLEKNSRPSGRSRAKAKDGNRLHSELLSRWTGLDKGCEERGHVAPGGREGSGSP